MEAILQETPANPIVPYQSSDQGNTPPFPIPDFIEEGSETPPATPTRFRDPLTYHNTVSRDVQMLPVPQLVLTPIHDNPPYGNTACRMAPLATHPPALTGNRVNEEPPTPVLPPILDPLSTKNRLDAAVSRNNTLAGKFNAHNALDKYTASPLPSVHNAHPTAVFEHIDTDFTTEWDQHLGGKLLAHPFDGEAQDPANHVEICELIFMATLEITKSMCYETSIFISFLDYWQVTLTWSPYGDDSLIRSFTYR